jgi:DNA-binding CsgD family transcriptional regulator
MIKSWQSLISRLDTRHARGRRYYELDESLHARLVSLAEREQRPAQELQAELLATALVQRQAHGELYECWQSLSPREQQVSALTCRGYTNRQMAARLGVSEETIKSHVRNALVKFNLHGKSELRISLGEWDFSEWE